MRHFKPLQMVLVCCSLLMIALVVSNCTKTGLNASRLSRALVNTPDSTIFSPFYDATTIAKADVTPDVNDVIQTKGVLTIIKNNCVSASCHGVGGVEPNLTTYAGVKSMVVAGSPEQSELFKLVTTSDMNKAMPPVNYGVDLTVTEKTIIYNWIKNGAKEKPAIEDFRPTAISLITNGCGSANCHNEATATGAWARKGLLTISSSDTTSFNYINPATGLTTVYAQLKEPVLSQVWGAYKDSVRRFYSDTLANASFRPYKTFALPVSASSTRGPLNTYDDILLDINYPKSARSNTSVQYINPVTLQKYYAKGDFLNVASSMISRVDSTILIANPRTGIYNATHQGDMAYGDGGLTPAEIAIIKAWYFADPNIPDVWKYGPNGTGIFKYRKTGNIIQR
ncbi:MAG: hypothetical protein RLY16_1009 [Bacteroidota bacterium]|jgi:hypothetical protein